MYASGHCHVKREIKSCLDQSSCSWFRPPWQHSQFQTYSSIPTALPPCLTVGTLLLSFSKMKATSLGSKSKESLFCRSGVFLGMQPFCTMLISSYNCFVSNFIYSYSHHRVTLDLVYNVVMQPASSSQYSSPASCGMEIKTTGHGLLRWTAAWSFLLLPCSMLGVLPSLCCWFSPVHTNRQMCHT